MSRPLAYRSLLALLIALSFGGPARAEESSADLERAKLVADGALREQRAAGYPAGIDVIDEVIELDQRLVTLYISVGAQAEPPGLVRPRADDLPAGATFDPRWSTIARVLFLYEEIVALDDERPSSDHVAATRALLDLALVLEDLPWHIDAEQLGALPDEADVLPLTTPHETPDSLAVVDRLLERYPSATDRDLFVVTRAHLLENRARFAEAEAALVELLARRSEGAWLDTARAALQRLRHPSLTLTAVSVVNPGGTTALPLRTRNVAQVRFDAWRVDLEAVLANGVRLRNPHVGFGDFQRNFGNVVGVRKHYLERVATWQLETGDAGDHAWLDHDSTLPLPDPGAYVVEATGGKVDAAMLVIVSDITVIVRQDETSALIFVADARDGFPLEDFPLIVKETCLDPAGRGRYRTALVQAWTGPDGTFRYTLSGGDMVSSTVAVLASEGELIAVTDPGHTAQLPGQRTRSGDLELITDRRHHEQGDTLRLGVQSRHEDRTVLLSFDGDDSAHHVLEIDGRSAVVELPLTEAHVPDLFVHAAMAHDYRVLVADREVFVSPTRQLLQVTVELDAGEVRPGREGSVTVTVRDADGQPVQGEFSLAVEDHALHRLPGDRRHGAQQLTHSRAYRTLPMVRDRNRQPRHPERDIPYPQILDGLPQLAAAHGEPVVLTDETGRARVAVTWPDTLTTWDVVVRGIGDDSRVGAARVTVIIPPEPLLTAP
jgi:hypothetical protein